MRVEIANRVIATASRIGNHEYWLWLGSGDEVIELAAIEEMVDKTLS